MLPDEPSEVRDGEAGETFVLEGEEKLGLGGSTTRNAVGPALRQEGRLPASPNADHGEGLPPDPGKPDIPPGQVTRRGRQGFVELEAKALAVDDETVAKAYRWSLGIS
jgi:hypothetical protein